MTYIFTKETTWLKKWDYFVLNNPKAGHLLYSDWLRSYESYGFDFEVSLVVEDGEIVGGCGVIIPKFLVFKFYIIPHGPIYAEGYFQLFQEHLSRIKQRAMSVGVCYLQLSMPVSSNQSVVNYTYSKEIIHTINSVLIPGKQFPYVYTTYGLNWINITGFENAESFLSHLTPKVRRNIRMPYNKGAEVSFVSDAATIKAGYDVIIANAKQLQYSVRSYNEFKNTILELVAKKRAYFLVCKVAGEIKAAGFFVLSSEYITNIMGGVLREKPDIKLGYMLQWEMIKKSFELGHQGYNISMGGSPGVQDFKSKFGAETIAFEDAHYHLVLKPLAFKLFKYFDKHVKPHKAKVSKLLAWLS